MPPPGATVKARKRPSGYQSTRPTGSSRLVIRSGLTPSAATFQTCGTPLWFETKARLKGSGEKLGDQQAPMRAIRVTSASRSPLAGGAPVAVGAVGAVGAASAAASARLTGSGSACSSVVSSSSVSGAAGREKATARRRARAPAGGGGGARGGQQGLMKLLWGSAAKAIDRA